jgi:hypothetical protein
VVLAGVGIWRVLPTSVDRTIGAREGPYVGFQFDGASSAVDGDRSTVLVFLSSACRFCIESMPWYRGLVSMGEHSGVRIAFTGPEPAETLTAFLEANTVDDALLLPMPKGILITFTPTILLVGPDGYVTASWVGMLNSAQEERIRELVGN